MTPSTRLPFYIPLDPTRPKIWPDFTLLVPICAVGNIGQLACDLIISTLLSKQECQLIGRLYSPALMPVVGPNAYSLKGPPTTSSEVYESKKHKLVIIQQRTSYYKDLKQLYIDELTDWIKSSKFDNVLVLTSSFSQCNPDLSQLGEINPCAQIHSITTSLYEPSDRWKNLNIKQIPDKKSIKVVQDGLTFLPGSGITKPLIKACKKAFIPAAFLVDFCSEGINIHDCYEVVNLVDNLLELNCSHDSAQQKDGLNQQQQTIPQRAGDGKVAGDDSAASGWVEPLSWTRSQQC